MDIWTVGANWYLRSNFKLMLNYVMVDSKKYSSGAVSSTTIPTSWKPARSSSGKSRHLH